jgi:hypothetical protein
VRVEQAQALGIDLVEEIALRVVELLEQRQGVPSWLSADQVADVLGVERGFVYEHAADLGGRRLGDGPRARLRFRLKDIEAALPCLSSRGPEKRVTRLSEPKHRRRRAAGSGTGTTLLPIRGRPT